MSPARTELLDRVAQEIHGLLVTQTLFVGIDGVDGAGKTYFADELAQRLGRIRRPGNPTQIIRASVDGFHNPRRIRYAKGKQSPQGFYLDSYDYAALKTSLLDPLKPDGSGHYVEAVFDHRLDHAVECPVRSVEQPSILLFDGIFLHRGELVDYWDYSIYLDVSRRESLVRNIARAGGNDTSPDPSDPIHARYVEGQRLYHRQCNPKPLATRVINNEDFDRPYFDEDTERGQ